MHISCDEVMKKISESKSVLSQVMLPSHANPRGTVHGGEIMKLMDTCGGVAAKRHSRRSIVTVRVDELVFYEPIHVGELVTCEAQLVFTGRTSMEVEVTIKVEDLNKDQPARSALSAYFTYVALDEFGKPCSVPELLTETEAEKERCEERRQNYLNRNKRG